MIYEEKKMNLFDVEDKYYLAHCISADYKLGAGIAVQFEERFKLRNVLNKVGSHMYPDCILIGRVFNLVTKANYWNKPTYGTLTGSLVQMKDQVIKNKVKFLAMPAIGCGLDKLEWSEVRDIIKETFKDLDIEILICFK
jgi:hypothetical protein